MKTLKQNRLSPLNLRHSKRLKNRIVVPAMASQTADMNGVVTDATQDHYKRLADSGAGLIILEYSFIHESGKSEPQQLGVSNDLQVPALAKLATIIQMTGALAGIQLTHSGGKSSMHLTAGRLMAPSHVAVPVKGDALEIPIEMTLADIDLWIDSFVSASKRAFLAGFDLIELHAAHGYGLNQWLSPLTNHRRDAFGGNLANRLRLLDIIIKNIKQTCPALLVSVRIPGQDHIEGGLSIADGIKIAQHLEWLCVDLINVSSGIGGWRRPRERNGEGYLIPEALSIQRQVSVPVIGVGGIESGEFIDGLIADHKVQLTAVGRALLKNPTEWGAKNLGLRL